MKKLVTLLLAAGLVVSAANGASAVELRVSGTLDFAFEGYNNINGAYSFLDNEDFLRNTGTRGNNKHFDAVQRMRLGLEFIMSENLSGYYEAQVGTFTWGGPSRGLTGGQGGNLNENLGGALGSRAANLVTRQVYLDWMIPNTDIKIRMGQQLYRLPSYATASPVLDDTATGVTAYVPFNDKTALSAYWIRALSDPRRGADSSIGNATNGNFDLLGLNLNLQYDGFEITPWGAVGFLGNDADLIQGGASVFSGLLPVTGYDRVYWDGDRLNAYRDATKSTVWFGGIGGQMVRFDPFRLAVDFYYSGTDNKHSVTSRQGWFVAASADYRTPYGVPTLKGWYASGDDGNPTNGSERPLSLSGAFNPGASIYFHGRYGIANTINNGDAGGTWGLSAQWNNLSLVEDLFHSLRVTYFQGTNNKNMPRLLNRGFVPGLDETRVSPATYLTTKDHVIEVDFDTTYSIYKNLATVLELGYAFQNFDDDVWRLADGSKADYSNAWRAALNFRYTF